MAWEIGVIVDPHYNHVAIGSLDSDMPIWIINTAENKTYAETLRAAAGEIWLPEPVCTTFDVVDLDARDLNCLNIMDSLKEHHPHVAKIHFVGVRDFKLLCSGLKPLGFIPSDEFLNNKAVFVRPIASLSNVPRIQLDASKWKNSDDIFKSLFAALGAPDWHGKNFDALNDSIASGGTNALEVPYSISIYGLKAPTIEVDAFVADLVDLISDLKGKGCPVTIDFEDR